MYSLLAIIAKRIYVLSKYLKHLQVNICFKDSFHGTAINATQHLKAPANAAITLSIKFIKSNRMKLRKLPSNYGIVQPYIRPVIK